MILDSIQGCVDFFFAAEIVPEVVKRLFLQAPYLHPERNNKNQGSIPCYCDYSILKVIIWLL